MTITVKYCGKYDKNLTFNIHKKNNGAKFDTILNEVNAIGRQGIKTNIKPHKVYKDNLYISLYKTPEMEEELTLGKKYTAKLIKSKIVNDKNYMNFRLTDFEEMLEEDPEFTFEDFL